MSSTRLCPACRRSMSLLHCRRIQPPDSLLTAQFPLCKLRRCRSLVCGGACLSAQPSRLCIAALCGCCLQKTRESQVFVPDAPRTTQLYYHAEALRPHVAARRYHSLRVSPALHPPGRPTPLAAGLIGHASQHALPRRRGEWKAEEVYDRNGFQLERPPAPNDIYVPTDSFHYLVRNIPRYI